MKLTDVVKLANYLKTDIYAERNREFEEDERFYNLKFKPDLDMPSEYYEQSLVLSTARDMVDTYVNHTSVDNARVYVNKGNPEKVDNEESKEEKLFGQGLLYMTNLDSQISPWWLGAKHYWLHGMAVFRTLWAADLWPDKPVKDKGESDESYRKKIERWQDDTNIVLPIRISAINPHNVYPDPDTREIDYIIEINEYHWTKATRYDKWRNKYDRTGNEKVEHISYWDKEKHIEIVDQQAIIKTRSGWDYHEYGFIPYVILNSGLGNLQYDGNTAQRYVGLLRYAKDLLIAESASFSINHIVLKKNAWPGAILVGDNAVNAQMAEGFGKYSMVPDGVEIKEYQKPVSPPDLMFHWQTLHNLLGEHGAPKAMLGESDPGVRSGSHQRLNMAGAATRLVHAEMTFKNRIPKALENCAKLVKIIPGDITVRGQTNRGPFDTKISKSKMKEPFSYYVEFAPVSEEDEYRRHDDIIRLRSGGIYTQRKAWEQMTNVDPDTEEKRMIRERMMASPSIQMAIDKYIGMMVNKLAVETLGADAVLAGMGPMQQQMPYGRTAPTQQMTTGPMSPNMSQRAQPGSPQAMQNQLAQNRSPNAMTATQGQGGGGNRMATR